MSPGQDAFLSLFLFSPLFLFLGGHLQIHQLVRFVRVREHSERKQDEPSLGRIPSNEKEGLEINLNNPNI